MGQSQVSGTVASGYEGVRDVFQSNLDSGSDVGASFCATKDGEVVVDLWGGHVDGEKSAPWEKDTIVNVYSTTKTMTFVSALLLADRGELDFDAPVSKYWPQFAQNGKAGVKVSHFMAHSAGLCGWKEPLTTADIYDWDKATSLLAAQTPFWEPGTALGYHALTQGFLIGEVVRRITGQTIGTFFRKEIAEPLDADFHIGLPANEDSRVAHLIPMPPAEASISVGEPTDITRSISNPPINPLETRTRAWRGAEIPAAGGTGNARSVATIHMLMANGGEAKGKRILSEAGVRRALECQIEGVDLVLGTQTRYGLGFGLAGGLVPLPSPNTIYWGGYGGSLIVINMDNRSTVAYAMNKMASTTQGDMRAFSLAMAAWGAMAG